jgi:TetR/AcrR family transcriptional regulator, cholesterol catabolism regulator
VTVRVAGASRMRVLEAAERLFAERGYAAVTLRDIADEIGIRQASLYHHAPRGKEQLYVEVTERGFIRHRANIEQAMATATDLHGQLRAVARWLVSQPPMDLNRIVHADLPALSPGHAQRLAERGHDALLAPIERALAAARGRSEVRSVNETLVAGSFVALIGGLHTGARLSGMPIEAMADEMVDVLLDGLRPR